MTNTTALRTRSTCGSCSPTSARRSCASSATCSKGWATRSRRSPCPWPEAIELIAREDPDLAFVVFDGDDAHGLALISETVEFASGPVLVTMREVESARTIAQAADMGIAGYVDSWAPEDVQGAIEVAMAPPSRGAAAATRRSPSCESALERRAVIERAKGILMERHSVDDRARVRAAARPLRARAGGASSTSRRACSTGTRCCRNPLKSVARPARQPALTSPRRASATRARRPSRRRPPR